MPYIITSTVPASHADPVNRTTRRAAATLDAVRDEVSHAATYSGNADEYEAAMIEFDGLTHSGGTIGPLPDGTVITVELATWESIDTLGGFSLPPRFLEYERQIIAAYNRRGN